MQNTAQSFKQNAQNALNNQKLQKALHNIKTGFIQKRANARQNLPEFDTLRTHAETIKNHTLNHLDLYLEIFENNATKAGSSVHWANNHQDACQIITKICQTYHAKHIIKSKSMVSEEIHLNQHLENNNLTVTESDLGEYIIQIRNETPSHIIAPAVHLNKEQVEENFRKKHTQLNPERHLNTPEKLVKEARQILRQKYLNADVGITGANLLIAETGSAVIVTNEGNADLSQTLPKTHIIITSIEKIIPTLEDATLILRLLARSATGQEFSAYTTLTTGHKQSTDPDGPKNHHIILLDNGRSDLIGGKFQDMLRCIRCGACLNHCPVYQSVGGHAYGWIYPGPMGAVLTPHFIGIDQASLLPDASTFCGRCQDVCPMNIPLPEMMRHWREEAHQQKITPKISRSALSIWGKIAQMPKLYHAISRILIPLLWRIGKKRGAFSNLSLAKGWTQYRDFPIPQRNTFRQIWEKQGGDDQ